MRAAILQNDIWECSMARKHIHARRTPSPSRSAQARCVSGSSPGARHEPVATEPGGLVNPLEAPADGHGVVPEPALLIGPVVRIRLLVHQRRHGFESGVAPVPDRACGPRNGRAFQRHSFPQAPQCFGDRPRPDSTPGAKTISAYFNGIPMPKGRRANFVSKIHFEHTLPVWPATAPFTAKE